MCSAEAREIVVGLVADPGMANELAEDLRGDVARTLGRLSSGVEWTVRSWGEQLSLDPDNRIRLSDSGADGAVRDADIHVFLTDLPRQDGTQPIVAYASPQRRTAILSLPALGGIRIRSRALGLIVELVRCLAANDPDLPDLDQNGARNARPSVRRVSNSDEDGDIQLTTPGWRGRARLLGGMVRDNRPWRLVPQLSKALAAAAAAAAFGIFYPIVWSMADHLSPLRLTLISMFAVSLMVGWLIAYNELWERPGERRKVVLYNSATVITVAIGVLLMYFALFSLTLLGAVTVIPASYLSIELRHEATVLDYVALAWLASSMGTIAGALGSSMETRREVQHATFSRREQARRAKARQVKH